MGAACCADCDSFCSPVSGHCYGNKNKDYYKDCRGINRSWFPAPPPPACCADCARFCSPVSGHCHDNKNKHYYKDCREIDRSFVPTLAPTHPVIPACCYGALVGCSGFCSPQSCMCYPWKKKDYYLSCNPETSLIEAASATFGKRAFAESSTARIQ